MPRPREFEPDRALEDAMTVFWEKGYGATSVEDLVAATGVNRYSLYDIWESKHGLFLAALEHYYRTVITEAIHELEQPGAGRAAIEAVFARIVSRARTAEGRHGCLLCNVAEEVAPFDPAAARVVTRYQRRLERGFSRAVATGQDAGAIPAAADPRELGSYLAGLIQGASYLVRSPASARQVADLVTVGLRVLD